MNCSVRKNELHQSHATTAIPAKRITCFILLSWLAQDNLQAATGTCILPYAILRRPSALAFVYRVIQPRTSCCSGYDHGFIRLGSYRQFSPRQPGFFPSRPSILYLKFPLGNPPGNVPDVAVDQTWLAHSYERRQ